MTDLQLANGFERAARMSLFLGGYLLAWAACGTMAFAALSGAGRLLTASPTAAKWLGVAIFTAAGVRSDLLKSKNTK